MTVRLLLALCWLILPPFVLAQTRTYTDAEARTAWNTLQQKSLTETTFRQSCDLIQAIEQTKQKVASAWLGQYVRRVQKTGNQRWLHILLINWGDHHTLLKQFGEAEPLFRQARQNARSNPLRYCQALVYTIWLYSSWDKPDSVTHYIGLGEPIARQVHDCQTLAFLYIMRGASQITRGHPDSARRDYDQAVRFATGLPDKNALFTARCNKLYFFRPDVIRQMAAFDSLLTLTQHPSLAHKGRYYERTTFYHRNPRSTVLYELIGLNLLLADYENAGRFANMLRDEVRQLSPGSVLAPFLNAQLASVRCQQGKFAEAQGLLATSRQQFGGAEADIPSLTYFLAAGLLAEHNGRFAQAVQHYRRWLQIGAGPTASWLIPPELFYARALIKNGQFAEAGRMLAGVRKVAMTNRYTTVGLYYFQLSADLSKARHDHSGYKRAMDTCQIVQTWLTRLNQYRAAQRVIGQMQLRHKEQYIARQNAESEARTRQHERERLFYITILSLAGLTIALMALLLRNRQVRTRQREALQQSQLEQLETQRHIDLMAGVMEAETRERLTIADELHNDVNPMLAVALLNVSSALETVPTDAPTGPKLRRAQDMLASVTSAVRGISHRLTPQLIEQQGFRRAVEDLAESINMSEKVRMRAIVVGFETALPLPFLSDLYRIVQELVHNVIKHAHATEATIEVIEHDQHITIMVEDNGIGIAPDSTGDGQGLQTIRAKVALRQGQMDVQHGPNKGTLVVIDNLQVSPN